MVSLITAPNHFLVPLRLVGDLNFPAISQPLVVAVSPIRCRRGQRPQPAVCVDLENCSFGFGDLKRRRYEGYWCCWCKGWDSEGDSALEAEILEFMKQSENPEVFPTKAELVDAGRMDLAEAIVKRGGWLSLGWDLDDDNEEEKVQENRRTARDCDDERVKVQENEDGVLVGGVIRDYQQRVENRSQSNSFEGASEVGRFEVSSDSVNSSQSPSFSGGSLGMGDGEETGIEGILSRLVKQRNLNFGNDLAKNGYSTHVLSKYGDDSHVRTSRDAAGESSFNVNQMREAKDASKEETLSMTEGSTEPLDKQKEISHDEMQTRLQHLELELKSALRLLWSKSEEFVPKECHETSSNDFSKLSDAWEFQENEIMNAQDRLRSIRAKLAVLERKMALAITDTQKIVEGKEKRIDGARRALQLLRSACIVWPNSASEVKLAGSYDGWTTQRKMEKSKTGIFSVCLRLYPGRYEIKFIVDGVWGTDPLRPIVQNNGYENNLLIVM